MPVAAVLAEGVVVNLVEVPGDYQGPLEIVPGGVRIGDVKVGDEFVTPSGEGPAAEPATEISRVQLELWLHRNGVSNGLENAGVTGAVGAAGAEAEIRRRSAQKFRVDDPLLVALAAALEISDLPAAFADAANIE